MPNACKWNRSLQTYDCDQEQVTAVLKAACRNMLESFVDVLQTWFRDTFVPFGEAHPHAITLLGVLTAISLLRRCTFYEVLFAAIIAAIVFIPPTM